MNGQDVVAKAEYQVHMQGDFEVEIGAEFEATIEQCETPACSPFIQFASSFSPNQSLKWNTVDDGDCVVSLSQAPFDNSPEIQFDILDFTDASMSAVNASLTVLSPFGGGAEQITYVIAVGDFLYSDDPLLLTNTNGIEIEIRLNSTFFDPITKEIEISLSVEEILN